jgi:hypothetical protein
MHTWIDDVIESVYTKNSERYNVRILYIVVQALDALTI